MKTRLIVAAVAALGAGAAIAAGPMKDADSNGDGFVSLDEARAAHAARVEENFAKADTNGDGLLSQDERKAAREAKREMKKARRDHRRKVRRDPENIVERLDVDGSGSVSMSEFEGRRFAPDVDTFNAADTNGNGELDASELDAMMKARRAEKRQRGRD